MQVEIKIDPSCTEPKIIILTAAMTEDIHMVLNKLSENTPQIISSSKSEKIEVLEEQALIRIYTNAGKVLAVTDKGEYTVRFRLYELEERLNPNQFIRISHSEIINLKKVINFDLSFTGTICVNLSGFPLGVAIGYFITIISSLIWAKGYYSPCLPELVVMMGNEINAVLLQALLCGILGSGVAAISVIWELENWGIVKQTGIYFLTISIIMLPIAYTLHWMEHSLKGVVIYF